MNSNAMQASNRNVHVLPSTTHFLYRGNGSGLIGYKIRQTVGGNLEVGDPGRNWQVVILTWSVKKSDARYTLTSSVQSGHAIRGSGWWSKLEGERRLTVVKTFYGLDLAQVDQDPGRDQELLCTEKTWLACPCSQQKNWVAWKLSMYFYGQRHRNEHYSFL